jgi:hypothetical protein
MANELSYARNIGWTVWNYSKLISHALSAPRRVRKHLDQYAMEGEWPEQDLAELERLTGMLEDCALGAEATWKRIREAIAQGDADLIDDQSQVAIIRGGGDRPELRERLREIFGSDRSASESYELVDEARRLVVEVTTRLGDEVIDPGKWPHT